MLKFKSIYLILILLIISCDKPSDKSKINIGFSQCIKTDEWRKDMDHSMIIEASLNPNIKLSIKNANRNTQNQIEQIEEFINESQDIIIVSPHESKPLIPVIEKAYNKGIPIILLDRKIDSDKYTTFIGADNLEIGKLAAKYITSLSGAKGNVVEIYADLETSPGYGRSKGFRDAIANYPNLKIIKSIKADPKGIPVKELENVLENSNIDFVYCFNDVLAKQAWEIAKSKGKEKKLKIIGVDGLNGPNGGIQYVKNKILTATILYPTGGSEAIKSALTIADGSKIAKNIKLATVLVDSLNANIMSNQFDKISQQQNDIELQQNKIKNQEEAFTTQYNLTKLLTFFLIVILSLAIYSIYSAVTILKKKRLLEQTNEKIISQRNEIENYASELKISNEEKLNFFTGLSHEFKTPLTLIMNAIESISSETDIINSASKKDFYLMHNNSRRLLRLINQLLDYRKIEESRFNFNPSSTNLNSFTKQIFKEFSREAKRRNIEYKFISETQDVEVFLDQNLMDKVYFNLLSNAFKFTPDNGKISLQIITEKNTNEVKIIIKDSGMGIPKSEFNDVFNKFYQGSNNYKNSSGIGLSLSKNFIDLHKGTIEVKSENGTEFNITLKLGKAHLSNYNLIDSESDFNKNYEYDYLDIDLKSESSTTDLKDDKHTVLVIEDNLDLLDFIGSKLELEFNVVKCNGQRAIENAFETIPDIVICDLNLPEKDGFEICKILKEDIRTSHIPTIILTALNDEKSYLKALEVGTDLFLTKPFNLKVLKESIKGLLFNREKLRYYYSNNNQTIENVGFGLGEQEFIKKIDALVLKNLDNSSFTVEELAEELNISRVQLYRKIKALLNINISDYINNIRLEKAKELLKNSSLTISEVAYSCGFSSPNYFSTSFKHKYTISPKEFRQE